ncbi:MAG: AMP-binding protein, partial [Pseudomonadota bacterium]
MTDLPDIVQQFRETAATHGDRPAIRTPDGDLGFGELDAWSDRIAAGLAAQGARAGDRIGLYCINSADFAACYLGILKAGATVLPVNLLYAAEEAAYVLEDAGARFLIYHPAFSEKVAAVRKQCRTLEAYIATQAPGEDDLSLETLPAVDELPRPDVNPEEDVAAILYTSGTTGRPKGAMLTHSNLVSNTRSVAQALRLGDHDCLLVVLPMFHSFAATVGMLTPLLHGFSLAPVPRFDPGLVTETIRAVGATVFLGVP